MTPKSPVKKFRQLLQEQQEPFELEDYLSERTYLRKRLNQETGFVCTGGKLGNIKKLRKGLTELHRILRVSFKKLAFIKKQHKIKDLDNDGLNVNEGRSIPTVAESEKFSVFDSCSGQDEKETSTSTRRDHTDSSASDTSKAPQLCKLKVVHAKSSHAEAQVRVMKTGKPRLFRARLKNSQMGNGINLNNKVPEDTLLSATLWNLLLYSAATEKTNTTETAEFQELIRSNSAPPALIPKEVLHQTKQLLFNCVKEVVEAQSKRGRNLGSKKLGRLICEKMKSLGEGGEGANLSELLNSEYLDSAAEWRNLEPQKRLVGTEIGEMILKEMTNEVVTELYDNL